MDKQRGKFFHLATADWYELEIIHCKEEKGNGAGSCWHTGCVRCTMSMGEVSSRMRVGEESCVILSLPIVSGHIMGRKNPATSQVHQDQESWCPFSLWCICEHYSWCLQTCGACNKQKSKLETNQVWFKSLVMEEAFEKPYLSMWFFLWGQKGEKPVSASF